jgi:hypothetical protein
MKRHTEKEVHYEEAKSILNYIGCSFAFIVCNQVQATKLESCMTQTCTDILSCCHMNAFEFQQLGGSNTSLKVKGILTL